MSRVHALLVLAAVGLCGIARGDESRKEPPEKGAALLDKPQEVDLLLSNGRKRPVYLVRLTPGELTYKQSASGTEVVKYAARDGHVTAVHTATGQTFVLNKEKGVFETGPPQPGAGKAEGVKLSPLEQAIIDLVNQERAKEKLRPLVPHEKLVEISRAHSANMAKQNKIDHVLDGKNPLDRAREAGYTGPVWENAAWGQRTAAEVVKMWMNSPGHRANILNQQVTDVGVGNARVGEGAPFYTLVLGFQGKR